MSAQPAKLGPIDSRSSVIERVGPVVRQKIDQALVDRQPATYKAVYEKFGLQVHGVSFTAFYYYARKVRTNAALVEMARLSLPDDQPVDKFLPEIVGQRFLEAAL